MTDAVGLEAGAKLWSDITWNSKKKQKTNKTKQQQQKNQTNPQS